RLGMPQGMHHGCLASTQRLSALYSPSIGGSTHTARPAPLNIRTAERWLRRSMKDWIRRTQHMRRKSERARSERESDITLKLECVKLAQRALPQAFNEIMFAFAQEIHAWVLADDERPSRRGVGERRATTSPRHPEARARPLRSGEP